MNERDGPNKEAAGAEPSEPTYAAEPTAPSETAEPTTKPTLREEPSETAEPTAAPTEPDEARSLGGSMSRGTAPRQPRPLIERIGMAFIALVLAVLFAAVAVAAFSGGEPFLAVMGAIGCLMTLWVGGLTLFRG